MRPKFLSVLSVPHAKVSPPNHPQNAPREFVGWSFVAGQPTKARDAGKEFLHPEEVVNTGAFVQLSEPVQVPFHRDFLTHLREGDLLPADQLTAQAANLPWTK